MQRTFIFLAAVIALLAVGLGAFGAHGLRNLLSVAQLAIFKTGVEYQMWHALGLALVGMVLDRYPNNRQLVWAGWLMVSGILLFSGSLYALSLTGIREFGIITPFGGIAFLAAWLLLAVAARRL